MQIRRLPLSLLSLLLALAAQAQNLTTSNAFVTASVQPSLGWITISTAQGTHLSFLNRSILSLIIDGKYYTNSNQGPSKVSQPIGSAPIQRSPDVSLLGATSVKIGDTITTVWKEVTFDIVQRVYPVAFRASGQIVLSVRVVNHTTTPVSVSSAQWLNDVQVGNSDVPYMLERSYYDRTFTRVPPKDGTSATPPSFYVGFEHDIASLSGGAIGAGFTNDSVPPQPLGLTPCSAFAMVDWAIVLDYTYGAPASIQPWTGAQDMAALMQWPGRNIPGAPLNDSTSAEIFRTSYGTQEFCMCFGNAVALNFYPTHIAFDKKTRRYTPNPFPVVSMIFNTSSNTLSNASVTHSVTGPISIASGGTIALGGKSATYSGATIGPNLMQDFAWTDVVAIDTGATYPMDFNLTASGLTPPAWTCQHTGGACGVQIDAGTTAAPATGKPIAHILSRTGSYDGSTCNARLTTIAAYDTGGRQPISAVKDSAYNMTVSIPQYLRPPDTIIYTVQVIDSMFDGFAVVTIHDSIGNIARDTVRYCTIPDTHAPQIDSLGFGVYRITDTNAWDRGIDSIRVTGHTVIASLPTKLVCDSTLSVTIAIDTLGLPSYFMYARDCAGNKAERGFVIISDVGVHTLIPKAMHLYPNPATDEITIELPDETPRIATIQDLLGRTVAQVTVRGMAHVDASVFPEGTYIIRVGGIARRIVKTR